MKKIGCFVLAMMLLQHLEAQKIFSFVHHPKDSIDALELNFISAFDSRKEITCAFPEGEDSVMKNWLSLNEKFKVYLKDNGFTFKNPTKFFIRFYFTAEGTIAAVGYRFKEPIDEAVEKDFHKHLAQFSIHSRFGMTAKQGYAQCGNVTY